MRILLPLALAASLGSSPIVAQTLLGDLHPGGADPSLSSFAHGFTALGTHTLFIARDALHGEELWMSDGAPGGTRLVVDLYPGFFGSFSNRTSMTSLGPIGLFFARDATGPALWRTDGTAQGTWPLRRFARVRLEAQGNLIGDGRRAFVVADDGVHGFELWRTDGTVNGTSLVVDLAPGMASGFPAGGSIPISFRGSDLLFAADDGVHGEEAWISDGTATGTRLLVDALPGTASSRPRSFYDLPSGLHFSALDSRSQRFWHRYDPVSGSSIALAATAVGGQSTVLGDRIVYVGEEPITGYEPWSLDGATGTATLLADIAPGGGGSFSSEYRTIGNQVFFSANAPGLGWEPRVTDGTPAGTRLLGDLFPGEVSSGAGDFTEFQGQAFFVANLPGIGTELFRSDGTLAGTVLVADIAPGAASSGAFGLAALGGRLWFVADDQTSGREPWSSDGTAAGTTQVADIADWPTNSDARWPGGTSLASLFVADVGASTDQAFVTDGTPQGTRAWSNLGPRTVRTSTPVTATLGDRAFTLFEAALHGSDLACANRRTLDATIPISRDIVVSGDTLYFASGRDLMVSDGNVGGARVVRNFGFRGTPPQDFRVIEGGRVFFVASDELAEVGGVWTTDGTAAGTRLLIPAALGRPSDVFDLAVDGASLIVAIADQDTLTLWRTDGVQSSVFAQAPVDGDLWFEFTLASLGGGRFVFPAGGETAASTELWTTDGTALGTRMLRDIWPGAESSRPNELTATASGVAYFSADDGVHGRELWITDGTTAGTRMVRDLAPGAAGSLPIGLLAVGDGPHVAFAAWTPDEGYEPCRSDGTGAGTRRVAAIVPGPRGSGATFPFVAGTHVVFPLDDGVHGREPWGFPMRLFDARAVDVIGAGCAGSGGRPPRLATTGTPAIGDATFAVNLVEARAQANAALLFGGAPTPVRFGPDCVLYAMPSFLGLPARTDANGDAGVALGVPNDPALVGTTLTVQWIVSDPGGAIGGVLAASDAGRIVVGR